MPTTERNRQTPSNSIRVLPDLYKQIRLIADRHGMTITATLAAMVAAWGPLADSTKTKAIANRPGRPS